MTVNDMGCVNISEDVLATIASLAASEVKGVANMQGSVSGNIGELLGKKSMTKGIKVILSEDVAVFDAHITVEYGSVIPTVATNVQENIKTTVESMTDIIVKNVDVYIEGVTVVEPAKVEENKSETQE